MGSYWCCQQAVRPRLLGQVAKRHFAHLDFLLETLAKHYIYNIFIIYIYKIFIMYIYIIYIFKHSFFTHISFIVIFPVILKFWGVPQLWNKPFGTSTSSTVGNWEWPKFHGGNQVRES